MDTPQDPMQAVLEATRIANLTMHARQLSIPVLNNFELQPSPNQQTIFIATLKPFTEQLVADGPLNPGETLDQRIDLIKKNTMIALSQSGACMDECSYFFFKDFKGKIFDYKIYIQDLVYNTPSAKVVIRMFNAFFVEPKFNDVYQLSLSVGPMKMPTEIVKLGVADLEHDKISMTTYNMLINLMDNLKYKD